MHPMPVSDDRAELVRRARENACRVAERLRLYEEDLARVTPGDARGGEALREAAEAARHLSELLNGGGSNGEHPEGEGSLHD